MGILLIPDSQKADTKPGLEYVAPFYWLVSPKEESLCSWGIGQPFDLFFNPIWNCLRVNWAFPKDRGQRAGRNTGRFSSLQSMEASLWSQVALVPAKSHCFLCDRMEVTDEFW